MKFSTLSAVSCSLLLAVLAGCGPQDGESEFAEAVDAYGVRDLKKAERLFTESLAAAPADVDRLLYLARVKLDLGELSAAQELVAKAQTLAPSASDVALFAAQLAWHAKDYKKARALYGTLASDAKLPSGIRAEAFAGLGVVEVTENNFHLARIAFLRALRIDRRNASAWYHLGLVYRELGYVEAALDQFDTFVHLEELASPRVQKVQQKVIPELRERVAQASAERPGAAKRDSAASAAALGSAEGDWKRGRYKDARANYAQALKSDPLSYPAALGLARCWEKTDATKEGQSKAFENYRVACALRPSAVSTFLAAGALAAKLGNHAQAVEIFSRAVAANPTSLDAIDGLIRALNRVGGQRTVAMAYQAYRDVVAKKQK